MSSIIYHSNFFAKQLNGLDRKFLRTPLYTINNLESVVNCSNNYSKFRDVFYPTLTKILCIGLMKGVGRWSLNIFRVLLESRC